MMPRQRVQQAIACPTMHARRSVVNLAVVLFLLFVVLVLFSSSPSATSLTLTLKNIDNIIEHDSTSLTIKQGGLPSYTGWGRPERTLAPFYRLHDFSRLVQANTEVRLVIECQGHEVCETSNPSFFVRAYGPSIITGQSQRVAGTSNRYQVSLHPVDPGAYTVEIVLTFSNLPDFETFPLPNDEAYNKFLYEGYQVCGSPSRMYVQGDTAPKPQDLPFCTSEQLVETTRSPSDHHARARWRVVDQVSRLDHQQDDSLHLLNNVTLQGYQKSLNSIGLLLDYQYTDCRLMPEPTQKVNLFQWIRDPIHIILIGDSTFRLQRKLLEQYVAFNPQIRVSFLELYGGYFKTQLLSGPNVLQFLKRQIESNPAERRVILFNTGLHDIHRLCGGKEMVEDRSTYLPEDLPASCVALYKIAVETLARDIAAVSPDTDVKIFQTTTAAWHKYGNYGVAWDPRYGQPLPLDTSFIEYFNNVATNILRSNHPDISIVDGYYVSYARPDNREIDFKSEIGKKLSHPGVEVISALVRTWSMLFLQRLNII